MFNVYTVYNISELIKHKYFFNYIATQSTINNK